jgi:Na+/H+ antiporter NhaC
MGTGISGMGDLIVVTLLAAGMLAMIKHNGGIEYLIKCLTRSISGIRGAQATIAMLVSIVNVCTANNTIAIITVGELSRQIAVKYNLDPRKVASILDTCSCVVQCVIPYGAQILLAAGLAQVSPTSFLPHLYYAWALALMVVLSIIFRFPRPHKS